MEVLALTILKNEEKHNTKNANWTNCHCIR